MRFDSLGAGVHLTGGCSLLGWIGDLAEEVFGIPAQLEPVEIAAYLEALFRELGKPGEAISLLN